MATLLFGLAVFLAPVGILVLLVLSVKSTTEAENPPAQVADTAAGTVAAVPC